MKLSLENLARLPASVGRPAYRRESLSPGIVHFGVGNFHRAHQAVHLDDLFNRGRDHDWAIIGAGVRPADEAMRATLSAQDHLTTVVERNGDQAAARVVAPMVDFLPPGDAEATVARLADPSIRIVSLTITEGGYYVDPASGSFDPQHPDIVADIAAIDRPKTVFGLIVAGLARRRRAGVPPFTVMSCDNLPGNGVATCNAVAGLADGMDPALGSFIREAVAFPNGMVDRITPATGDGERRFVRETFGIEDGAPVVCEDFRQWVVEDHFPGRRPALEEVGVTFVEDVAPYELMKIRILNGGHAAIAYPAALLDIVYVHEAMGDPVIRAFLAKLESEEIIPIVPPVPDIDLGAYFARFESRLLNWTIGDTIARLCQDGSNRQPKFILPSAVDRLDHGAGVTGLALVSALWCRYCAGTTDSGHPIAVDDVRAPRLTEAALKARDDPMAFLSLREVFGTVADREPFRRAFATALAALLQYGTRRTLERYLSNRL